MPPPEGAQQEIQTYPPGKMGGREKRKRRGKGKEKRERKEKGRKKKMEKKGERKKRRKKKKERFFFDLA